MSEPKLNRLESLDVARGFDMLWISGLSALVVSVCRALGYGPETAVACQMEQFFRVLGMNALTIYLVQRVVGFRPASSFLFGWLGSLAPAGWEPVVVDVGYIALCWLFLLVLYRNKLFFKV